MTITERGLTNGERAMFRLRELYGQYGYTYYKMSKFEEYDLYARNKSFLVSENVLTFTDTDGKLMALKPDVTLSIVKNARRAGSGSGALEKVYYNENVYRASPASHGYREIMQAGLECIGELDLCAMGEVALLAAKSLEAVGGGEYLLDLSHLGVVTGLLEEMGVTEGAEVLSAIGAKNAPAIAAACEALGLPERDRERLCRLALLYGSPKEVLPRLREMTGSRRVEEALGELEGICALLGPYGERARLDFSMVDDAKYYSGLIFRGFLPGLPSGVLSGGRYDSLVRQMGREGGALGFAVYLDRLERLSGGEPERDVDVLLLYGPGTDAARAAGEAERLRAEGLSVRLERAVPEGLKAREIREVG